MLENSFVRSFEDAHDAGASSGRASSSEGGFLTRNIGAAWTAESDWPVLLLNATWVQTGFRVAFSPFPLRAAGRGTLYSLDELAVARDQALAGVLDRSTGAWPSPTASFVNDTTVIEAAVVSARFPFIMPPWLKLPPTQDHLWSFVDGGYADSSGATTGLELFNALDRALKTDKDLAEAGAGVSLHLIVLTDAFTEADLKKISPLQAKAVANGEVLQKNSLSTDILSPAKTLFAVRDLLARRAVTEAHDQLKNGESGESRIITIELDQQTFPLPLTWKISGLSNNLVRFTMGAPEECGTLTGDKSWSVQTVERNSCALKTIMDLLAPRQAA